MLGRESSLGVHFTSQFGELRVVVGQCVGYADREAVAARRGEVLNWSTTPSLDSDPTPEVWDWSQTDGSGLAKLDKLGNWNYFKYGAEGSESTDDRGHNTVNEITSRTCTNRQTPTWDAGGNLTCDGITDHSPFGSNTKFNYVYDYRNCLMEVYDDTTPTAKVIARYTYDALNERVRKQTYDGQGQETSDTWFLWSGWRCIEERDRNDSDAVLRRYVYGATYIDEHAAQLVPDGEGGWTVYYTLQDRMQNVVALADSSGNVVERYDYSPYGKVTITDETGQTDRTSAGSSYGTPYTYTGRYWDADAGLYYCGNRWCSPDLGRYTTRSGYVPGSGEAVHDAEASSGGDNVVFGSSPVGAHVTCPRIRVLSNTGDPRGIADTCEWPLFCSPTGTPGTLPPVAV